jgi:Ca2+-binding RTX toxin-like protein
MLLVTAREAGPMLIPRGRGAAVLFGTAGVGGAAFVTGGDGAVFATGGGGGAVFVSGASGGAAFVTGGDGAVFVTGRGGGAVFVAGGGGGGAAFAGGGASAITGAGKATNSVGCASESVRANAGCIGAGWLSAVRVASVPELAKEKSQRPPAQPKATRAMAATATGTMPDQGPFGAKNRLPKNRP